MKTWLRSSKRLTAGPENALALKRQISYSYGPTSMLHWQVESAILFNMFVRCLAKGNSVNTPTLSDIL
jgi:hypothetical protein